MFEQKCYLSQAKRGRKFRKIIKVREFIMVGTLIMVHAKNSMSPPRLFVISFSSHTSEAWGLKIVMHFPHMDGLKFTNQIFDILSRSWDISCFLQKKSGVKKIGGFFMHARSGGLGIFPYTKNTLLLDLINFL